MEPGIPFLARQLRTAREAATCDEERIRLQAAVDAEEQRDLLPDPYAWAPDRDLEPVYDATTGEKLALALPAAKPAIPRQDAS